MYTCDAEEGQPAATFTPLHRTCRLVTTVGGPCRSLINTVEGNQQTKPQHNVYNIIARNRDRMPREVQAMRRHT